jgi:carboxyl-terminal processing protease
MQNFLKRYSDGEMMSADSTHFPDSLKYSTNINHRKVYGGGGIMPDIFVPADTSNYSDYYRALNRKNVFQSFTLEYSDKNRATIKSSYPKFDDFKNKFTLTANEISTFTKMGEDAGVKFKEKEFEVSKNEILKVLKAMIAGNLWQTSEFYRIYNEGDVVIARALKVLGDEKGYNKILGY